MTIIIGIDPGSRMTGYGVIDSQANQLTRITSGCINTGKGSLGERLVAINHALDDIIRQYQPSEFAIEQVFVHRNVNSALKLGQARGAAIVAAASHCLDFNEYSPRQIKQAVVGYGGAAKEQVQHMIKLLLKMTTSPGSDEADALAVAICHANTSQGIAAVGEGLRVRGGRLR